MCSCFVEELKHKCYRSFEEISASVDLNSDKQSSVQSPEGSAVLIGEGNLSETPRVMAYLSENNMSNTPVVVQNGRIVSATEIPEGQLKECMIDLSKTLKSCECQQKS